MLQCPPSAAMAKIHLAEKYRRMSEAAEDGGGEVVDRVSVIKKGT